MTELEKAVQHHVHEEESETLPRAKSTLGEPRLADVGDKFEAAKARSEG